MYGRAKVRKNEIVKIQPGKKDRRVHCKLKRGWRDERMIRHEGKIQAAGMKDERKTKAEKRKKTGMREKLQRERKV